MIWSQRPARVRAPATSANLGPGFDALGLALALYDEVEARVTDGGLAIEVSGEGSETAAAGEQHLVVRAMRAAFGAMGGGQPPGIALRCVNAIPHGRGLGSSAAAVCCGLLAARALAGPGEQVAAGGAALPDGAAPSDAEALPDAAALSDGAAPMGEAASPDEGALSDEAVFQLAAALEGHPDNVAACLSGGLTIAWSPRPAPPAAAAGVGAAIGAAGTGTPAGGAPGPRLLRIAVPAALRAVACVPSVPLATEAARGALPPAVPHADAAANAARSALLVAALTGAPEVLFEATEDLLHQPYRSGLMPETTRLLDALRRAGAAAVVSGAGPTVLVLSFAGQPLSPRAVGSIAGKMGSPWDVIPLRIDQQGAHVQQGGLHVYPSVSARHARTWNQGTPWNRFRGRAQITRENLGVTGPASCTKRGRQVEGMPWAHLVLS
jgi:homoserine kinase